jgi:hypothetical protein
MLLFGVPGCATSSSGTASRSGSNLLTREELTQYASDDVLNTIRRLRPRWLQARGASHAMDPVPFLDGARLGSLEDLRGVNVGDVESVEFVTPVDATMKYGTGFPGGAIEVTSRVR